MSNWGDTTITFPLVSSPRIRGEDMNGTLSLHKIYKLHLLIILLIGSFDKGVLVELWFYKDKDYKETIKGAMK